MSFEMSRAFCHLGRLQKALWGVRVRFQKLSRHSNDCYKNISYLEKRSNLYHYNRLNKTRTAVPYHSIGREICCSLLRITANNKESQYGRAEVEVNKAALEIASATTRAKAVQAW